MFISFQLNKVFNDEEAMINRKLPKELLLRIFSYLDVVSLCRCAQVSKSWNILALDGSNWQRIDLFDFQKDVEVNILKIMFKILDKKQVITILLSRLGT